MDKIYTKHASSRMQQHGISKFAIELVFGNGNVNWQEKK